MGKVVPKIINYRSRLSAYAPTLTGAHNRCVCGSGDGLAKVYNGL